MSGKDLRSQLEGLFSDVVLEPEAEQEEIVVSPTEAEIAERERREVHPTNVFAQETTLREERARIIKSGLHILLIIIIIIGAALCVLLLGLDLRPFFVNISTS